MLQLFFHHQLLFYVFYDVDALDCRYRVCRRFTLSTFYIVDILHCRHFTLSTFFFLSTFDFRHFFVDIFLSTFCRRRLTTFPNLDYSYINRIIIICIFHCFLLVERFIQVLSTGEEHLFAEEEKSIS